MNSAVGQSQRWMRFGEPSGRHGTWFGVKIIQNPWHLTVFLPWRKHVKPFPSKGVDGPRIENPQWRHGQECGIQSKTTVKQRFLCTKTTKGQRGREVYIIRKPSRQPPVPLAPRPQTSWLSPGASGPGKTALSKSLNRRVEKNLWFSSQSSARK